MQDQAGWPMLGGEEKGCWLLRVGFSEFRVGAGGHRDLSTTRGPVYIGTSAGHGDFTSTSTSTSSEGCVARPDQVP